MRLDNSAAKTFRMCPYAYYESYLRNGTGIELKPMDKEGYSPIQFGTRGHELMEEHYRTMQINKTLQWDSPYLPSPNENLELEAMMVMAGYVNRYPTEDFDIVDVERTICVPLNEDHEYTGKIDVVYRDREGVLNIMDHKFQMRSAKSNLPQQWAARDQATLYLWAAEKIYGEPIGNFFVNVVIRPSPAGLVPPTYPDRQKLERTEEQKRLAVRDLILTADLITEYSAKFGDTPWPSDREKCYTFFPCEFYQPHTFGIDENMLNIKYQPKTPYLNL